MGREERTFIDGHLSLHHVDVFERQFFYHFIFSISSLGIQRDIRNIITTQEEIDGEKESFCLEPIARDIVCLGKSSLLEAIARRWIEDITAVAGNRTLERLDVIWTNF